MKTIRRILFGAVAVAALTASAVFAFAGSADFTKQVTIPVSKAHSVEFYLGAHSSNAGGHHSLSKSVHVRVVPSRPLDVNVSGAIGPATSI